MFISHSSTKGQRTFTAVTFSPSPHLSKPGGKKHIHLESLSDPLVHREGVSWAVLFHIISSPSSLCLGTQDTKDNGTCSWGDRGYVFHIQEWNPAFGSPSGGGRENRSSHLTSLVTKIMFLVSNFLIALPSQLVLNPDVDEGSVIAYQLEPRPSRRGCALMEKKCSGFPFEREHASVNEVRQQLPLATLWGPLKHYIHTEATFSTSCLQPVSELEKGDLGASHSCPVLWASPFFPRFHCRWRLFPAHLPSLSFASSCSSPLSPQGSPLSYISCTSISCLGIFFPKDPSWHHQYYNALQFTADEGRLQSEKRESINTFPFKKFMHTPEMRGSLKKNT